jgi:hypothetical protein
MRNAVLAIVAAAMLPAPQASAAPGATPADDGADEILVVAERMRRLKLDMKADRKTGISSCVFRRRSGDAEFDAIMCNALLGCAKTVKTRPQMEACIGTAMAAYIRVLATRRVQSDAGHLTTTEARYDRASGSIIEPLPPE